MSGSMALCKLEANFRFTDQFQGVGVLLGILAGLVVKFVCAVEAPLRVGNVDLFLWARTFHNDGDPLGEHFDKTASHVKFLISGFAAVESNHSGCDYGKQRRVPVKGFEVACPRWNLDRIHGLIDEDAIGNYEPDL